MHSHTLGRGIATLGFVHRDDTPADDLLVADLRDRLDRASMNDPLLGTVELTISELTRLLDMYDDLDALLLSKEFLIGVQAKSIRKRNATHDAIDLALIGQSGPLADTIGSILRKG